MFNDLKDKFMGQPDGEADTPAEGRFGALSSKLGGASSKLEGFDKKRIYTAFVALVIAGAAGHFMQRTASGGTTGPALTASVQPASMPATQAPTTAPMATPVEQAAADQAAPEVALAAGAAAAPAASATDAAEIISTAAADIAPSGSAPIEAIEPVETVQAEVTLDPTTFEPIAPAPAFEEVTRAAEPDRTGTDIAPPTFMADTSSDDPALDLAALSQIEDPTAMPMPVAADPAEACGVTITAAPLPAAMVALSVDAPCHSAQDVEFIQNGLRFSERLGPDGSLDLMVPGMSDYARFTATFEDGIEYTAEASLPDFGAYERVAVVWKGATGLQLHALENGATYGEPGHVWAEEPAMPTVATEGKGGFVSVLGSTADGYAADVYTYPASLSAGIEPDVSIEAQVMENTCGKKIEGMILRSNSGRAPTITDLTMAVPDCDAVGEYLVLKNLPQDLKIARN